MSDTAHAGGGHEQRDVSYPPLVLTSCILGAIVFLSFVTMWWLLSFLADMEMRKTGPLSAVAAAERRVSPPAPQLQVDPLKDMDDLLAAEDAILETYGWVDKSAGVARLPIDKALAIVAEKGLGASK